MKKTLLGIFCIGCGIAVCAEESAISRLRRKLSGEPLAVDWHRTVSPYGTLKGVERIGRTPVRHSRDIAESPVGIGFETLDRKTFDPSWTYRWLGEAGVKWARCQTGWIRCEKEPGVYDFKWLDDVVDGLAAEGIATWFSLSFGNPLYTPNEDFANRIAKAKAEGTLAAGWARGYVGEAACYHGEKAMAEWCAYVRAIAAHFRGRVKVWEVWNEPEWFFRDKGQVANNVHGVSKSARDFAAFVRVTAEAVRSEIPDAKISFNLAELSCGWLVALANAGIGETVDIFNYHGYETYPEAGLNSMFGQIRTLMKRPDGTPLEIWQGESGRATDRSNNGVTLPSRYSQARFIARRIVSDVSHGAKVSSIFTVTDFLRYYGDGRDQYYGVLDGKTRKPKHGWHTLQCLGWLCDGLVHDPGIFAYFDTEKPKEFADRIPYASVRTAAFRRKGVPVLAVWQPQHVELNERPLKGRLEFVIGENVGALANPVLIDPVRCEVFDVATLVNGTDHAKANRRGIECAAPFFALDYPLFLTDASIFDE